MSKVNKYSKVKPASKRWQSLYRVGGIAALLAAIVFRRNLSAEVSLISPIQPPQSAVDWFILLYEHPLLGLTYMNLFDLLEYLLVGLMFLAVYVVMKKNHRSWMTIAVLIGWVGVGLNYSSNQAFAMLALSGKYMVVSSDFASNMYLAAGEALLAQSNGSAAYASLFFVSLAGLVMSIIMLQSSLFSRLTGVLGILANGIMLLYFIVLPIAPSLLVLPFVLSAPFRVVWYILVGLRLLKFTRK
jgi:hypothetical protein